MGKKVKEYKTGDFIFAKVKGYPAWPARVQSFNGKKYMVYFYGTGETANLPPNMIFDYAENKDKFLNKAVKRRDFNEGVQQIAHDFAHNVPLEDIIGTVQPVAAGNDTGNDTMEDSAMDTTAADDTVGDTTAANDTAVDDSDETGALVIDEGKQQAAKGRKSKAADPAKTPKTPAPRVRGKGLAATPSAKQEEDRDKEEIVSRSGRKIRPKRYLDEQTEENATLPAPAPKKKRGATPPAEKETAAQKDTEKKEKEKPTPQPIKQFNNVPRSELEELKEPFKPENPDNENILIAYLPSGQYVGIKLFQNRPNAKDEAARLQWDRQSARNALLLAQRLERGDITPQSVPTQLVTDLILTDEERTSLDKQREAEEKKYRIQFLKTEMRLIELDAKIKTCLCLERADTELCLTLLDQLTQLDVKPLMLLKHPTCLETVKRMRAYVGNTPSWGMNEQQALAFSQQAHRIRGQAHKLYKGLKELFPSPEGISFWEYFSGQVLQFKQATATLGADQLLEMVHPPQEMSLPSAVTMAAAAESPADADNAADPDTPPNDVGADHQPAQKKNARTKKSANSTTTPAKQPAAGRRHSARRDKTHDSGAAAGTADAPSADMDTNPDKEPEQPSNKDSDTAQPTEPEPTNEGADGSEAPASPGTHTDSADNIDKDSENQQEEDKTENDISKEDKVIESKDSTDKPTNERPKRSGRSKKNSEREDEHSDKKETSDRKETSDKKKNSDEKETSDKKKNSDEKETSDKKKNSDQKETSDKNESSDKTENGAVKETKDKNSTSDKKANSNKAKDSDKNKKSKDNGDKVKENSDKVKENSDKVKENSDKAKENSDEAKDSSDKEAQSETDKDSESTNSKEESASKENSEEVKEKSERVKEKSEKVKENSEKVKENSEKAKESSEKAKEKSEKAKENSEKAKESSDSGNGEEKDKEDEPRAKRSRGENKKADPPTPSRPSLQRKSKA